MEDKGRRQVGDPAQSRATGEAARGRTQRPRRYEIINQQCPQVSSLLVYNCKVYWSNRLPSHHSAILIVNFMLDGCDGHHILLGLSLHCAYVCIYYVP